MNKYLLQMQAELAAYEQSYPHEDAKPAIEILWDFYLESKPIDDGRLRQAEEALSPIFDQLNFDDSCDAFKLVYELCSAYQHAAFYEGIRIGSDFANALHKKSTP